MVRLATICTECCFCKNNTECSHNLLPIYLDRGAEIVSENSLLQIDRVCPYRRTLDWESDKTDEEKIEICKNEIYVTGTLILIANNAEELESAIDNIENIEKFKIIILYRKIKAAKMLEICGNKIQSEYRCILMGDENINTQVYRSLKYAKNGYLIIVECSKSFDLKIIDKINHMVNKKLFRLLHVEGTDGLHESVSMIHLYKWIKGDLEFSIKEKLEDIANQEGSDAQVFTWKEVNEQYIN